MHRVSFASSRARACSWRHRYASSRVAAPGASPRLSRVVVSPSRGVMGGHGGLNILPHKSWNVYGAKQRARVERDEALAREIAEEELRERENDARSARWKALGVRDAEERAISGGASTVGGEHVNLFAREEMAAKRGGGETRNGTRGSGTPSRAGRVSEDVRTRVRRGTRERSETKMM